jgi:phosphoglycerate dehydrogenase-like enzyme
LEQAEIENLTEATSRFGDIWFATDNSEENASAFKHAEVAVGNVPAEWLAQTDNLRWLQLASVGVDSYAALDWSKVGAPKITNLAGVFADPVAQTCLAGILALLRGIDECSSLKQDRKWAKDQVRPRLRVLTGARVLLLGTGAIASRLADLLSPFDCEVRTFGRSSGDARTTEELDAELKKAEIVVGLLPDTPETRNLLNEHRLRLLPRGAIVVNAGRGSLVDERALDTLLRDGDLGGAILDVTSEEPLPFDHFFWTAPRTVLTQHTAGGSDSEMKNILEVFIDNLHRYFRGEPLRNIVDWSRGY